MSHHLPKSYLEFQEEFPEVFEAYQALGEACHRSDILNDETRRLVKLALAIAIGSHGAVHAQVRRALEDGIEEEKLKQVAVLAIPTIGFPRAHAALTWIKDLL